MNIAIDSGPLTSKHSVRGVGFYTKELIEALNKQRLGIEKLVIDDFDFSSNKKSLVSDRYDIVHFTFFHLFFPTLPLCTKGKLVVTIHDLIPLIYPKHYPSGIKGKLRFTLQKFLIKKADAIITVSETSKKDIVRFLSVPQEKIHVVYEAPRQIFKPIKNKKKLLRVKNEFNLPKKFVLYVGDVNYNKNIFGLIKACRIAKKPLVIVGKQAKDIDDQIVLLPNIEGPRDWIRFLFNIPHPELSHYKDIVSEFNKSKNIMRTGFVSDEDLVAIYNLATVYCQPSFYEGFGLPVLEAMACGTPVVASKTQSLVEISGDISKRQGSKGQVVLFADPESSKDLASKISEVFTNSKLSGELARRGKKRALGFSWNKTAKKTVEVYKKVLKG